MTAATHDPDNELRIAGETWVVSPGWASRLFDQGQFLPPKIATGSARLKQTRSRIVDRVTLVDGARVVVKRYLASALEGLARRVARSPAREEFDHARSLAKAGVPVVEPLAAGADRGAFGREFVFVSREVPAARELRDLLRDASAVSPARRHGLAAELGRIFRRIHDAGLALGDPHLGNFLVEDPPGIARLWVVDPRRLDRIDPADLRARAEALALLVPAVVGLASIPDRGRFLHAYGEDLLGRPEWRGLLREAAVLGRARLLDRAQQKARGTVHGDRRFESVPAGGCRWIVRRGADDARLRAILADPEAFLHDPAHVLKAGRAGVVALSRPYVIKRADPKRWRNMILDRFRLNRSRRTFATSVLVETIGVRTPRVLAAGQRTRWGLVRHGYLVVDEVPAARHLLEWVRERRPMTWLLREVGRLVARLHDFGLDHRDLKANNLIVTPDGTPWLVDLDGIRWRGRLDVARRAYNLNRLFRDLRRESGDDERLIEEVLAGYFGWCSRAAEEPLRAELRRCRR